MNLNISPSQKFLCAGVIVIKKVHCLETILVKTHKNHYSFPKGKLEKGETYIEGALREMNEETGLASDDIELLYDTNNNNVVWIEELSPKGNPSVLYFVARYVKKEVHKFTLDEDELVEAKWHTIDAALKLENFRDTRKNTLANAIQLLGLAN